LAAESLGDLSWAEDVGKVKLSSEKLVIWGNFGRSDWPVQPRAWFISTYLLPNMHHFTVCFGQSLILREDGLGNQVVVIF